jgi:hypothetical protein
MFGATIRLVNIISVILFGYTLTIAAYLIPYGWVGALLLLMRICRQRAPNLTSYGSARWANIMDCLHRSDARRQGAVHSTERRENFPRIVQR